MPNICHICFIYLYIRCMCVCVCVCVHAGVSFYQIFWIFSHHNSSPLNASACIFQPYRFLATYNYQLCFTPEEFECKYLRFREMKWLVQNHTNGQWWDGDLTQVRLLSSVWMVLELRILVIPEEHASDLGFLSMRKLKAFQSNKFSS